MAPVFHSSGFWKAYRPRIPHAAVLGLALALMDTLRSFPVVGNSTTGAQAMFLFHQTAPSFIGAAGMIAAITWVELVHIRPLRQFALMAATVVLGAVAATLMKLVWSALVLSYNQSFDAADWLALSLYLFWMNCATSALAAAYYEFWERAAQSAARLRGAELERQGIEQRVVQSRLTVMKARIEPAFLFNSMANVQRLYRSNTDAAEKLLDDLIVYLRAALPQLRGNTSSLGDEIHLVASYLKLHDETFDGRLEVSFDVPEAAREQRFPPMVLLPLVDDALHRARAMSHPALSLAIAISMDDTALYMAVVDDCPLTRFDTSAEPALTAQEHSLTAFYGDAARLARGAGEDGGTRIMIQIPRSDDARSHR